MTKEKRRTGNWHVYYGRKAVRNIRGKPNIILYAGFSVTPNIIMYVFRTFLSLCEAFTVDNGIMRQG